MPLKGKFLEEEGFVIMPLTILPLKLNSLLFVL